MIFLIETTEKEAEIVRASKVIETEIIKGYPATVVEIQTCIKRISTEEYYKDFIKQFPKEKYKYQYLKTDFHANFNGVPLKFYFKTSDETFNHIIELMEMGHDDAALVDKVFSFNDN